MIIDSLENRIIELRKKLKEIFQIKGGFIDEEVVEISRQLDELILEMQKKKRSRN
ncbi:aspartyl-phosphate phosphatase Spo0E family protein [Paenibacillus sp. MER 180]|uniref:Spo0E family sporulation regulatory protein-aspartic acid phosphatase n=1 Tax=Paenibacillus sp. MER 180 TaxID=2939570 RepID=UPI00203DEF1F|nr:aspartyl-phosphate phosphatase Spo0E family protein [Paenibacillus sp. MER 180]MCM3293296.1 aspartyl-phosphate phosphatase Spo0E family protein [Paenibacillus sp. MER 180]